MIQALQLALSVLKHIQKVEHPYHRASLPGELDMAIELIEQALNRGWQGLTDNERRELLEWAHPDIIESIELKLQERNT